MENMQILKRVAAAPMMNELLEDEEKCPQKREDYRLWNG